MIAVMGIAIRFTPPTAPLTGLSRITGFRPFPLRPMTRPGPAHFPVRCNPTHSNVYNLSGIRYRLIHN